MSIRLIQIEKAPAERLVDRRIGSQTEAESNQPDGAMGDRVACDRERHRWAPGFGKQLIQNGYEIRRCVSQSSVEIEQYAETTQAASGRLALTR